MAANEDQQAIRQVRSFIELHGESRFTPKQTGYSGQVRQRAGWIDRSGASLHSRHTVHPEHNTSGPQTLYLFYPTGWREATEGLSPDRAAKALVAAGYLIPDGNRPQRKVSLPDNTRPRTFFKINRALKAVFWMTKKVMSPVRACRLLVYRQST